MRLALSLLASTLLLSLVPGPLALASEPSPGAAPPDEPPPPPVEEPLPIEELAPEDEPPPPDLPPEATPREEATAPTPRKVVPDRGAFPQGKVRIGAGGGLLSTGSTFDVGFNVSFGYFIFDNVELGADTAFQFGDSPFSALLGPTVRVLFPINGSVYPYLGAFYRHWFFSEGLDDADTIGARLGVLVRTGGVFFGLGIVYEKIVSECSGECSDLYPEVGISVVF